MKKSTFALVLTFFTLSIVGGVNLVRAIAQDNQGKKGEAVEFKTLAKNFNSEEHEAKNMVIRTRDEWAKLWEALHINSAEKPELPEVDFDNRMIIAVFSGDKPNPGYDIAVLETLRLGKKKIRISYKETTPGANCVHPAVLAQPYHIIETEIAKKVAFSRLQEVRDCRDK